MNLEQRNQEMREFFREKAEGYDDVHMKLMPSKTAITELLPDGVKKVLDLGAGTGLELIPLFERFPDACVKVIDISPEMLEELKKRSFADRLEIVCGDFFAEDFGSGYDAVISTSALHHFDEEDKTRLYAKIFGSLKAGGVFINSDRCLDTKEDEDEVFYIFRTDRQRWHHFDTPLAVCTEQKILESVGFADFCWRPIDVGEDYKVTVVQKPE